VPGLFAKADFLRSAGLPAAATRPALPERTVHKSGAIRLKDALGAYRLIWHTLGFVGSQARKRRGWRAFDFTAAGRPAEAGPSVALKNRCVSYALPAQNQQD
jgi:hypothetical protein